MEKEDYMFTHAEKKAMQEELKAVRAQEIKNHSEKDHQKKEFRRLVNPDVRPIHIYPEDYGIYLETLSKEMYAENMILVEIGMTLLPMLLNFIDPEISNDVFSIKVKPPFESSDGDKLCNPYIAIIKNYIPMLKNMTTQRAEHERILKNMSENIEWVLKSKKEHEIEIEQRDSYIKELETKIETMKDKFSSLEEQLFGKNA